MEPSSPEFRDALKAFGRSVGLDLIGVARPEPFGAENALLRAREELGYRSAFEEPDIDLRTDPQRWLPGVQSIIACGISYKHEGDLPEPEGEGPRGWLSKYCRGSDYHYVLHRRLEQLMAWLDEHAPAGTHRAFVDTGPPIDRAVAQRAGLGFFGKSNLLITREYGTWVFLGEVLTTLSIAPDAPWTGTCGECTRCLDACPTGALTDAFTMNASLCLSYVTQMPGSIPTDKREALGNKLFGCDTCQDVCPYNKMSLAGMHPEFAPRPEPGPEPDLAQILHMTKGQFKRWFLPTAAGWRGKTTLQRNAVIALGNSRDPRALPLLEEALADGRPVLRSHAAWGLGQLGHTLGGDARAQAGAALQAALATEDEAGVRQELAGAIRRLDSTSGAAS